MELRVIRDELQYEALLHQAKELAISDPMPGSQEANDWQSFRYFLKSMRRVASKSMLPIRLTPLSIGSLNSA